MKAPARAERETIVGWDEEEKTLRIFTSSEIERRKLDKLCEQFPDHYRRVWTDPNGWGWKYEAPPGYLRFKKPSSEAVREANRRKMYDLHERRKLGQFTDLHS